MIRSVLVGGLILMSGISLTLGTEKSPRNAKVTVSFRNGVDGYSGTIGSEIWALAPTTILDGNGNASTDADNDGGESQVLLRFDGIIGSESRQVPPNAVVHSTKLLVSAFDQGRSAGSNTLMSVSEDGTLREWDMHEGKQLRIESENIGGLLAVDSAAAGPFVVGGRSGKLAIRQASGPSTQVILMDDEVTDLAVTQDATHVIAAVVTGNVRLFNLETGSEAGRFHLP